MAITTGQLNVGITAVQIDGTSNSNYKLHIHNMDNTDTLFIGNGNLTTANGLGLPKLDSIELNCYPGETIWVVSPKTGHSVSWLKQV
jgi:hypothetical protein